MYKTNQIISLRQHGGLDHVIVTKRFEEEMNSLLKEINERKLVKKKPDVIGGFISKRFVIKDSFKKCDVQHKEFLEDFGLLIVKKNLLIQFMEHFLT
jgi:hypothetical protein